MSVHLDLYIYFSAYIIDWDLRFRILILISESSGAVHKLCYAGGGGVWPSVTIGLFSYLSKSEIWPKVLHGGTGGGVKNGQFWRNIIYGWPLMPPHHRGQPWGGMQQYVISFCRWASRWEFPIGKILIKVQAHLHYGSYCEPLKTSIK